MWFPPEDGAEFYDFELEPGGPDEWECSEQTDELRRLILYLVHEKNAMLVKLRGLSALREVLQNLHSKQERDQANQLKGAENCQELVTRQTQRGEKLEKDSGLVSFKDDEKQDVYTSADILKVSCFVVEMTSVTLSVTREHACDVIVICKSSVIFDTRLSDSRIEEFFC